MELTFEQIDGYWVSEFEVSADFNLHIERDTEGRLDIYQRTAGGRYEYINDIGYLEKRLVYDYDFSALVYPKWIKIKSKVKPLICTITTDGEVNELKYQEKSVEITSNGTTKVTPDTGYNGLAQVNVKVDVPTEGGGSSEIIPQDVVWDCNTEEGCKEAFETLLAICKNFEEKIDESNKLPLYPWFSSVNLVKWDCTPTHIQRISRNSDGEGNIVIYFPGNIWLSKHFREGYAKYEFDGD